MLFALILSLFYIAGVVGTVQLSGYRKGQILPTNKVYPTDHRGLPNKDSENWELKHSEQEEQRRDFWDFIAIFSFLWPIEAIITACVFAVDLLVVRGIVGGIKSLHKSAEIRGENTALKIEMAKEFPINNQLAIEGKTEKRQSLAEGLSDLLVTAGTSELYKSPKAPRQDQEILEPASLPRMTKTRAANAKKLIIEG